jgi:cobalt-zinc-cadmium efflux system outer membrane protein
MFLTLLLVPSIMAAEKTRPLTIQEALRLAETMAPASRAIDLQVARAREQVRASGLWPNPELFLSREESAGTVERFSNLSQALPLWGRLGLERSAARSGFDAALASAGQERIILRARVREAFITLLLSQEQARWLESGRDRLTEIVEILRAREQQGESSGFDLLRAERALAEVEADRHESRGMLGAARAVLGAFVGLPTENLEALGSLAAAGPLPSLEEVRGLAAARGDLRALDAEAAQADGLSRAAKRRLVPEPTLTAGTKTSEGGVPDATGPVVALAFSLPLFDRAQSARVAQADAEVVRARREALALQVGAEVKAAHARAAARRDAEAAYLGAADPDSLVRIARAAYEAGEMKIFELLDAYRTALDVRLRAVALQGEARRAEVALDQALGREMTP